MPGKSIMWGNKKTKHKGPITSLIGRGTKIVGDIDFTGGLHIDGEVYGNITTTGDEESSITISEFGHVVGEIHIPNVVINGHVEGNIYSSTNLELLNKAKIKGNIYYHAIEMAVGSEVNGSLEHEVEKIEPIAAQPLNSQSLNAQTMDTH